MSKPTSRVASVAATSSRAPTVVASRAPSATSAKAPTVASARAPTATSVRAPTAASRRPSQLSQTGSVATASTYELRVLNATTPLHVAETEQITVNNVQGVYANKKHADAWKGDLAIAQYPIHNDANPQVITKKSPKQVYTQVNSVKVLKPCDVKPAGDIVIVKEQDKRPGAAPFVHVVVPGNKAADKETLLVREAPPKPPCDIPEKRIVIPGKVLSPPPRKVIVERIADEGEKPQNVIVERWLPYPERERKVVFIPAPPAPCLAVPKNVNIVWQAPEVEIQTELNVSEPECADPSTYKCQHGASLVQAADLPEFARTLQAPEGGWGADKKCYNIPKLVGDVEALNLVNLEEHGLSAYANQVPAGTCRAPTADIPCAASRPGSTCKCLEAVASRLSSVAGSRAPSVAGSRVPSVAALTRSPSAAALSRAPSAAPLSRAPSAAAVSVYASRAPSVYASRAPSVAASRAPSARSSSVVATSRAPSVLQSVQGSAAASRAPSTFSATYFTTEAPVSRAPSRIGSTHFNCSAQ